MATSGGKQSGGAVSGALIAQDGSVVVNADSPTTVTYNDTPATVTCVIASPPSWMDDAGNITAAGQYIIGVNLSPATPPTTPGLLGLVTVNGLSSAVPIDVLDALGNVQVWRIVTLVAADLPTLASADITVQTDITGECTATAFVSQQATVST